MLFSYGTLRQGQRLAYFMRGMKLLGEATVSINARMFAVDTNFYPVLLLSDEFDKREIVGEVYDASSEEAQESLESITRMERNASIGGFLDKVVKATFNGEEVDVILFCQNKDEIRMPMERLSLIECNDWVKYLKEL